MKKYYDILEVSRTASKEVIEKVYKILAKRYHPDTTKEINKQWAEEKFKQISEAYEILSDDKKRAKYDQELEQNEPMISYKDYLKVVNENQTLTNTIKDLHNKLQQLSTTYSNNASSYSQHNYNYTQNRTNINTAQQSTNAYTNSPKPKYNFDNHTTKKPFSLLSYFIYQIKKFIFNISLLLLSIIIAILIFNAFSSYNIFKLLFHS